MTASLPEVRSLARALFEGQSPDSGADSQVEAAERVLRRLSDRISPLVGSAGFALLLQRALKRARAEHPWLGAVHVDQETPWGLVGMVDVAREVTPDDAAAAAQALITELIGLVARFLGADMAIRLVRQSFPEVTLGGDKGAGSEENIHG